ncbi:hypothetical protein NL676_034131 [Syzygium grande]|nr:hypothetical protein NL676_034131 [Syzygium grande]
MARIVSVAALLTIFVFGLAFRGASKDQCSRTPKDITITQKAGGTGEGGKPKWSVTISNPCLCTVLELTVTCDGFDPAAQKIDPSILAKQGNVCLVNNGDPIHANESVSFTYEMDASFPFAVSDGQIGCS